MFFFLLLLLFENLFLSITFFQPTRVDTLEFCSLVGRAIYSLSHGSYRDFLPTFCPTGVFSGRFPSDSRVNCLLAVSCVLNRILRSCIIGCSITCHYSYWSGLVLSLTRQNHFFFAVVRYCVVELKLNGTIVDNLIRIMV